MQQVDDKLTVAQNHLDPQEVEIDFDGNLSSNNSLQILTIAIKSHLSKNSATGNLKDDIYVGVIICITGTNFIKVSSKPYKTISISCLNNCEIYSFILFVFHYRNVMDVTNHNMLLNF